MIPFWLSFGLRFFKFKPERHKFLVYFTFKILNQFGQLFTDLVFTIVYLDYVQFLFIHWGFWRPFYVPNRGVQGWGTASRTGLPQRGDFLVLAHSSETEFKILRIPQCFYQFKFEIARLRFSVHSSHVSHSVGWFCNFVNFVLTCNFGKHARWRWTKLGFSQETGN